MEQDGRYDCTQGLYRLSKAPLSRPWAKSLTALRYSFDFSSLTRIFVPNGIEARGFFGGPAVSIGTGAFFKALCPGGGSPVQHAWPQ
jgi:hypothetical protein